MSIFGPNFFSSTALITISGMLYPASASIAYSNPSLTLSGASGGGTWSLGSGAPSWLSVNGATGIFSGGPAPYVPGIDAGVGLYPARAGITYSRPAFTIYGAAGGGSWSLGSGAPSWLTIDSSTGIFGGTP